jgi:hypothetical protein
VDPAVWTLIGVVVGAFANNFAGEYYKRYRDRRALAFGLAGEIQAHIEAIEGMGLIDSLADFARRARNNEKIQLPPFQTRTDPVYEKSIENIGLLEGDLPERLASFYGWLQGSRRVLELVGQGFYGETGERLSLVLTHLTNAWNNGRGAFAKTLVFDLKSVAHRNLFKRFGRA